jgi:[acyl-carrier-protein] S-malonyltransferase
VAGTVFLFPGQGSQSVGMDSHISGRSGASGLLDRIEVLSGVSGLLGVIRSGPEDLLTRTDNVQPGITAVSLATLRVLASAGIRPAAAAGHSLGEYSALACAGILSEESALRLTAQRGSLMQRCADRHPGGMIAMIGATREDAEEIVLAASATGRIGLANINSDGQVVLSGESGAIDRAAELARGRGVRRIIPLKVSGAWHSPLMDEAATGLALALAAEHFGEPSVPVVANVTSEFISSGEESRALLCRQVTSPVLWAASIRKLLGSGFDTFIEVGPGAVLQGLLKGYGSIRVYGTGTAEALDSALEDLS